MLLLMGSWRAVVVGVSCAVSLVAAAYVLFLGGVTFTTMTLLGLAVALGLVVDDVVTDRSTGPGAGSQRRSPGSAAVTRMVPVTRP